MGFWGRVKDVLVSGPTTAVKNERAEDGVERAKEAAERAREKVNPGADRAESPGKVEVPPQSAPQPPTPTPADEPEYRTYTVKSGDTLSEIAASFGGQVFKVPNS